MNKTTRDQIIENDLGWARDIKVSEVDGRLMMGNNEDNALPYNVAHVMKEEEFVKKWLIPFAVGNTLGINYFNQAEWFGFSYGGTRAVLIVGLNPASGKYEPVMCVPPLVAVNLTKEDREKLRIAAGVMYANSEDASKKNDINANLSVANTLADPRIGLEAPAVTLTSLIKPEFFEKYFIVPEVERGVFYIRDVIRAGEPVDPKDLDRTRDILWRDHKGKQVTKDEYAFLVEFSRETFNMEGKVGVDYITDGGSGLAMEEVKEKPVTPSKGREEPESPFEC